MFGVRLRRRAPTSTPDETFHSTCKTFVRRDIHCPYIRAGTNRGPHVPLNIDAVWAKPIKLKETGTSATYICPELTLFPEEPAVYIFGREFGDNVTPIYIGKALNLRQRMQQQFDSVKLMSRLKSAANGSRFLIYCLPH
jgi:hypothetical protein